MNPDSESEANAVRQIVRQASRFALGKAANRRRVIQLSWALAAHTDDRLAKVDAELEELAKAHANAPRLACKRGCAFCCHVRVCVQPVDAFRIADYIARTFDSRRQVRTLQRLREYAEKIAGIHGERRVLARIPCPFLENDQCSIYPARPFICRSHHSLDVAECEKGHLAEDHRPVPQVGQRSDAPNAILMGLDDAYRDSGLATGEYELAKAMIVALDTPDAPERWLAGEDVFAPAQDPEISDLMRRLRPPP